MTNITKSKFDIFISYRRDGGREYARTIQLALKSYGYRVFFDFDSLKNGVFNTQIFEAIQQAPIFVLILSEGAMARCVNEDDWLRQEIEYSLSCGKHIVPINVDGKFDGFPEELPLEVQNSISSIQYAKLDTEQLFDSSIELIVKNRITPIVKPRLNAMQPTIEEDDCALIRIKPNVDCKVFKFGEELLVLLKDKYNVIRLRKGKHQLDFISTENSNISCRVNYYVEDNNIEDFFTITLSEAEVHTKLSKILSLFTLNARKGSSNKITKLSTIKQYNIVKTTAFTIAILSLICFGMFFTLRWINNNKMNELCRSAEAIVKMEKINANSRTFEIENSSITRFTQAISTYNEALKYTGKDIDNLSIERKIKTLSLLVDLYKEYIIVTDSLKEMKDEQRVESVKIYQEKQKTISDKIQTSILDL